MDDKKKPIMLTAITPLEMFGMIEDFSLGLLEYMRSQKPIDDDQMIEGMHGMMEVFKTLGIESRIAIVIMLMGACSTFQSTPYGEETRCRYLN